MPPPPVKGFLPDKFSVGGNNNRSNPTNGSSNQNQQRNNNRSEPLRATEPIRGPQSIPADMSKPEEEQLNAAYHLYLQQAVINMINQKMAKMNSKVETDKSAEVGVHNEIIGGGVAVISACAPLILLTRKIEHLLRTQSLVAIYSEIAEIFNNDEAGTLDALQAALEAKFSGITLKDIDNFPVSPKPENHDQIDVDELITRIHEHLKPQEKPSDVKGFLTMFTESMKNLLNDCSSAEENSSLVNSTLDTIMDVTSMSISSSMVKNNKEI